MWFLLTFVVLLVVVYKLGSKLLGSSESFAPVDFDSTRKDKIDSSVRLDEMPMSRSCCGSSPSIVAPYDGGNISSPYVPIAMTGNGHEIGDEGGFAGTGCACATQKQFDELVNRFDNNTDKELQLMPASSMPVLNKKFSSF